MDIEQEIIAIKERNAKVELDKARETSRLRRGTIALLTYGVIVLFFLAAGFSKPLLNALIPTGGFLLSTLSFVGIKNKRKKIYLKEHSVHE